VKKDSGHTEAGQQYAAAHTAHYETKDLQQALERYNSIIAAHRDTQEAGYALSQILNIVNRVVPKQVLLDAQTKLALAHITP
jgi:hypothetical protein